MLTLLAQIQPPPEGVEAWLKVVFWLAVGICAVAAAFKIMTGKSGERTISPNPLRVEEHSRTATKAELEAVKLEAHGRIKRERTEIDAHIRRVEERAEKRSETIEGKIDDNTKVTERMAGQVQQMNQQLHQFFLTQQARK